MGGPRASEISELHRTAKWHDLPEEIREESDLLTGELKLFQGVAARFIFFAMDRPIFLLGESIDAENGFTTHPRPHRPQESCSIHDQIPANDLQICMDRVGQQY